MENLIAFGFKQSNELIKASAVKQDCVKVNKGRLIVLLAESVGNDRRTSTQSEVDIDRLIVSSAREPNLVKVGRELLKERINKNKKLNKKDYVKKV